ncbi:MAG: LL-diaminopimelate aminotransferase [Bacilli bacterium]|nr:LL-diaminopimelate aminotransferase [Bacilli bacterium]
MNIQPADRMLALPTQFFSTLVAKAAISVKAGHDVINLGQGNPDLPTPPHIVEALREAALDPVTHRYPPFSGLPELKQAVSDWYLEQHGVKLDPQQEVAILFGGKTGLVEIAQCLLNPGDMALVPDPGYPDYWSGIALCGASMHMMPLLEENQYLPDFERIPASVRERAKLIFLNYPNNPTGSAAPASFFTDLVEFAARNSIVVCHDFAYGAIGFDGQKPHSFLEAEGAKEVGIEIYTLSKTYNMAGWRVGFAVGNAEVIGLINLLQDHYYCSLFGAVQRAAITALRSPQDSVRELVNTYQHRRDAFVGALRSQGIDCPAPQGSFFTWVPLPPGVRSIEFAGLALEQEHVVVAPGEGFGSTATGYVRVALLTSEERLTEAALRLANIFASYPEQFNK